MPSADYIHPTCGPIKLRITASAAEIRIVPAQTSNAMVSITTKATSGPCYDAVRQATVEGAGLDLAVFVPPIELDGFPGAAHRAAHTVLGAQINSGSGVFVGGNNYGVISTGRGGVQVGQQVATSADQIIVTVELPEGSNLDVRLDAGTITSSVRLVDVRVRASSASVVLASAALADVEVSAGNITLGHASVARLHTAAGLIDVESVTELNARVSSGQLTVRALRGACTALVDVGLADVAYSGPEPRITVGMGSCNLRRVPVTDRT